MRTCAAAAALFFVIQVTPAPALPVQQQQEKHALVWKPPAKRILVVKVKCVTIAAGDKSQELGYASEAELSPVAGDSAAGETYSVRMNRLLFKQREGEDIAELKFERDKKPVFEGREAPAELKKLAGELSEEHKTVISGFGKFNCGALNDSLVLMICLGRVDAQLPMLPVMTGQTWETDVQIAFPGPDFSGKLTCALRRIEMHDKSRTARIRVTAAEKGKVSGEDGLKWDGTGEMIYSFDDGVIREFKFKLTQRDKDGKVLKSLDQEMSISLKP